jgi:hypothetical protein
MKYLFLFVSILLFIKSTISVSVDSATTISEYIGSWYNLKSDPNVFIYSGYGSMTNTYNNKLSSKRMERVSGYGSKIKNNNSTDYYAYIESFPLDGSYWLLKLDNITVGFIKYSIYSDRTGNIWVWGNDKKL